MIDKIKTGDLVQVIRPCPFCGDGADLGKTFIAGRIFRSTWATDCCGDRHGEVIVEDGHPSGGGQIVRCCKRIPPPEELGVVNEGQEITA